jgi:hypothetical protein
MPNDDRYAGRLGFWQSQPLQDIVGRRNAGSNTGTARIIGNIGAGDILVKMTPAGITFIEETLFGNLNITTVFANYDSSASQRFVAVASRHQNINGPFPSQYHGTCTILE